MLDMNWRRVHYSPHHLAYFVHKLALRGALIQWSDGQRAAHFRNAVHAWAPYANASDEPILIEWGEAQ